MELTNFLFIHGLSCEDYQQTLVSPHPFWPGAPQLVPVLASSGRGLTCPFKKNR